MAARKHGCARLTAPKDGYTNGCLGHVSQPNCTRTSGGLRVQFSSVVHTTDLGLSRTARAPPSPRLVDQFVEMQEETTRFQERGAQQYPVQI